MKRFLKDWFDTYGQIIGFVLFLLVMDLLIKGCPLSR